jgi:hypothetical protein
MTKKGYTLVEALIYIAVFVFMSMVIVSLILTILETGRRVTPLNDLSRTAVSSLEFITREIRKSNTVDVSTGTFDTTRVYLDSGVIKIDEDGVYTGPLSSNDVVVNALTFTLATSTKQDLIRIKMEATAGEGKYQRSETFYSAVKLRVDN